MASTEQIAVVAQRRHARGALTQGVGRCLPRTLVERGRAERAAAAAVGLDEELARRLEIAAALPEQGRERDGLASGGRCEEVAEQLPVADAKGALARLDRDPHRPAAHEAGIPRQILGELVLAQRAVARADDAPGVFATPSDGKHFPIQGRRYAGGQAVRL